MGTKLNRKSTLAKSKLEKKGTGKQGKGAKFMVTNFSNDDSMKDYDDENLSESEIKDKIEDIMSPFVPSQAPSLKKKQTSFRMPGDDLKSAEIDSPLKIPVQKQITKGILREATHKSNSNSRRASIAPVGFSNRRSSMAPAITVVSDSTPKNATTPASAAPTQTPADPENRMAQFSDLMHGMQKAVETRAEAAAKSQGEGLYTVQGAELDEHAMMNKFIAK